MPFRLNKQQIKVAALRPPRVLLIEDDEDIAFVVHTYLKMAGYVCKVFRETRDVCSLVQECKPDVVLVDFLLPEINGGELCSEIKNDRQFSHLPVIIYSAYSKVFLSLGSYKCDAFISKPFDLNDLVSMIENLISGC